MISPEYFYTELKKLGVQFFTGVPDSLLKEMCAYISDNASEKEHIISANEGGAVGLAVGHYLATGQLPVVYMQNSGLGNTVNPLLSLADKDVYSIPMLLVIGWRGEPNVKDEPQHIKQGKVTLPLLDVMDIDYVVIDSETDSIEACLAELYMKATLESKPVALVVRKGTFSAYMPTKCVETSYSGLTREQAIKVVVDCLTDNDFVVSTTGMASRELFEYRKEKGHGHANDFLTVGGMGHASQIATAIALAKPSQQVFCIDGDGAALMHLGALAISGQTKVSNFKHIIINNGAHDSVGGQPTIARCINITEIARSCGYNVIESSHRSDEELETSVKKLISMKGPALLEVFVDKGNRKDLGRPSSSPIDNKHLFMQKIERI